ncbi:MAG: hypothetical protein AB8B55_01190 [Mariniblastus sp.]
MSDNQRRAFCRILFICICVLPTTVVGYWICHPQTSAGWELAIQAQLGLVTKIDQVETPGPYVTILRNVEFSDPTDGQLFKASEVKISFFENENLIEIPHKVQGLTNRGLTRLIATVNNQLLRSHGAKKDWRIQFGKETVIEEVGLADAFRNDPTRFPPQLTLANLEIVVRPADQYIGPGNYAKALFHVVGSGNENQLVEFQVSQTEETGNFLHCKTNGVRLPCWLVANAIPLLPSNFGASSTFSGEISVTPGDSSQVSVVGTFEQLDLKDYYIEPDGVFPCIDLDCEFVNGNKSKWDAMLLSSHVTAGIPITFEEMQVSRTVLNPAQAILAALSRSGMRTAQRNSNQR